jgi:hypothetical protein
MLGNLLAFGAFGEALKERIDGLGLAHSSLDPIIQGLLNVDYNEEI